MHKLFTWDWKDQAPLADILEAFQGMVDYDQVPEFYLPDTGGDYYACIISEKKLTPEQVERVLSGEDEPGRMLLTPREVIQLEAALDEPVSGQWDSPGTAPEEEGA